MEKGTAYLGRKTVELIRRELKSEKISDKPSEECSSELLCRIYDFSKRHDVTHIVGERLLKEGVLTSGDGKEKGAADGISAKFIKAVKVSVMRYERLRAELIGLYDLFERARLSVIPLKGAVIRDLYPKPEYRSSCDIDLLIKRKDVKKAEKLLKEAGCVKGKTVTAHDVNFSSRGGVTIELHYDFLDDEKTSGKVFKDVFLSATPVDGYKYILNMKGEDQVLFFTLHALKHFKNGGCGIKTFTDLYFLEKEKSEWLLSAEDKIKSAGLDKFYKTCLALTDRWFNENNAASFISDAGDGKWKESLDTFEKFIFLGGAYGNYFSSAVINGAGKGKGYFLSRVFPPLTKMSETYPVLKKCPILLPFCYIGRFFKIIFGKGKNVAEKEFAFYNSLSKEDREKAAKMVEDLGI